jgi:hypothetical protein
MAHERANENFEYSKLLFQRNQTWTLGLINDSVICSQYIFEFILPEDI